MKPVKSVRSLIVNLIVYLYILLFVYAAVSKLLEFSDFQTQLGQSPILGAFAEIISYGVIISEILCSVLLATDKYKKTGLYFAFTLMVMFTAYIVVILNFSSYTPCSCGGVLESLGWTEHLIFNIVFIILAAAALVFEYPRAIKRSLLSLSALSVFGLGIMVLLFSLSDNENKRNNAFQRKYIPHALELLGSYQLESNAFYIAGVSDSLIYLGNYNAPKLIKQITRDLKTSESFDISLENYDFPFKRTKIEIQPPYFFLGDGTVPIIFRGKINNPYGKKLIHDIAYFQKFKPIDSSHILFTAIGSKNQSNLLGSFEKLNDSIVFCLSEGIIKSQLEGPYDSDGILLWNQELKKVIYVYYYRNQFEVSDRKLNFLWQGKTIDTISMAQVVIAHYKKDNASKMGKSTFVNLSASTSGNNLFIHSDRMGKYESDDILKSASIIDQYNILKKEYIQSYYFYHQYKQKLKEFIVVNDTIIGIVDDQLWIYKIKDTYFQNDF